MKYYVQGPNFTFQHNTSAPQAKIPILTSRVLVDSGTHLTFGFGDLTRERLGRLCHKDDRRRQMLGSDSAYRDTGRFGA